MKLLAALLALMLVVPPFEAGGCDMQPSGAGGQPASMAHHSPDQAMDHDCCDPEGSDDSRDCSGRMHCTGCAVTAAVVPTLVLPLHYAHPELRLLLDAGQLATSHTTPPFRPPRNLS